MSHLGENLSAYVSDELDESERKTVEEHVAVCAGCMEALRRLQKLDAWMAEAIELEPAPDFVERVLIRVEKERRVIAFRVKRSIAALAAAAAIVFFAFLLSMRNEPPPLVKKPAVVEQPEGTPPGASPRDSVPAQPANPDDTDVELIAHLDELENMEVIREFENLESLELALIAGSAEVAE